MDWEETTFEHYVESALLFANETRDWHGMNDLRHYTTRGPGVGWSETTDNAHGGMDISWAFHKDEDYIRRIAQSCYDKEIEYLGQIEED